MSQAYQHLEQHFHRLNMVGSVTGLLHWDAATYMPEGSYALRGEQLAAMAEISHEMMMDARLSDWLTRAEADVSSLNEWQKSNLREMRHNHIHETCLPADLVAAMAKASSASEHAWRAARKDNDYKSFIPHFKKVLELVREQAAAKADALGLSDYDALLDSYDPAMRAEVVDACFSPLEKELPELIGSVIEKQKSRSQSPISLDADVASQEALSRTMMELLGFDFTTGRQDVSAHPFCGGVPGDIRLTTRFNEADFTEGMFGVLHETGHALYEMGLPKDWLRQPVGQARGMSMHESQSLFVEMQVSRSRAFAEFITPHVKHALGRENESWAAEDFYHLTTKVERSLIRVNADEVTYPAHVMLRYNLEKALLADDLPVEDLPAAWNDGMERLVGIRPDSDSNGCLQDIHWPEGALGYFPTYTLGAMIAAQLFEAASAALPHVNAQIEKGEFASLFSWLGENIHSVGSSQSTQDMLQAATGKGIDPHCFIRHLKARYL